MENTSENLVPRSKNQKGREEAKPLISDKHEVWTHMCGEKQSFTESRRDKSMSVNCNIRNEMF